MNRDVGSAIGGQAPPGAPKPLARDHVLDHAEADEIDRIQADPKLPVAGQEGFAKSREALYERYKKAFGSSEAAPGHGSTAAPESPSEREVAEASAQSRGLERAPIEAYRLPPPPPGQDWEPGLAKRAPEMANRWAMPPAMFVGLATAMRDGLARQQARTLNDIEVRERELAALRAVRARWGDTTPEKLARITEVLSEDGQLFQFFQDSGLGADPAWLFRLSEHLEKVDQHNRIVRLRRQAGGGAA